MHTFTTHLRSIPGSRYYQSAPVLEPKLPKELPDDYEKRTWRKRAHIDHTGHMFIPPSSFKNSLSSATKYLLIKIPGQGNRTYAKHIISDILVVEPLVLPVTLETLEGEWLFCPSDGRAGGTKRVWKCFPCVPEWTGIVHWQILSDVLTEAIVREHLEIAGQSVGLGAFRPENRGWSGRFVIDECKWE